MGPCIQIMVKFLHTADWQIGMTRHYLSAEAQPRFSAARLDAIESIGQLAEQEDCEFVLVCGDVFESNQIGRQLLLRAFEKMSAAPTVPFFLLPGNHDPLDASTIYRSPTFTDRRPDNVTVLEGSDPVQAAPGVELVAAPWTNKHPDMDLVARACDGLSPTDCIRILAGHGAVDSMSPNPDDPRLISTGPLEEKIESGLIHYVALGDRHSTTEVGTTGRVWYSGAPEPTDYTETDPGNVLIVEIDKQEAEVDSRKLGTWRFVRHESHLNSGEDIDALEEWLSGLPGKDRTIARLSMVGELSLAQKARLDDIVEHSADLLAALETWERRSDLVVVPDQADLDGFGFTGFARDALLELRESAKSGDQAIAARDALALLYRLAGSSK